MSPSLIVDLSFGIIALVLAVQGWKFGFIRTAGSLIALVLSFVLAGWAMAAIAQSTGWQLFLNPWFSMLAFLFIALILSRLLGFVVHALDLLRKIVSIIPLVNPANRLLGLLLGIVQAGLVLLVVSYASSALLPSGEIRDALRGSFFVGEGIAKLKELKIV